MKRTAILSLGTTIGVLAFVGACTREDPNSLLTGGGNPKPCPTQTNTNPGNGGNGGAADGGGGSGVGAGTGTGGGGTVEKTVLDERVLSYTEALRTASLKLVGNAPTLEEMMSVRNAGSPEAQKAKYEELVSKMMDDVRFKKRLIEFFRNTFRMAGPAAGGKPSRDTAPTFAARIVFEGRPYTDMFLATTNTCPTFDGTNFADGSCPNGPAGMETVGVLTDPGVQTQWYGNLAFLRMRFFQETFACHRMPAEYAPEPYNPPPVAGCEMAKPYTGPWDFTVIGGAGNTGRINFQDCSSVICANCHGTMNHRAPLFANYDENGAYTGAIAVHIPILGVPLAEPTDWLIPGEPTAWKKDKPAPDILSFGQQMANDDEVIQCAVARVWNYAMSKGDAVTDYAEVPSSVIEPVVTHFKQSGFNLRATWKEIFLHDDFVQF